MPSRLFLVFIVAAASLADSEVAAGTGDIVDVTLTPALRKYCHIVRFPQGWKIQPFDEDGQRLTISIPRSDYEFRVRGLLSTWFLVGAFTPDVVERHYDATNHYRVNLSDPTAPVLPASAEDWKAATVVPLVRKFNDFYALWKGEPIVFNGFRFTKSGARWSDPNVSRLSPDSAWLVLQSFTEGGVSKSTHRGLATLFMDVFNANTGDKVLAIEANHSGFAGPNCVGVLETTAWLTERYFVVPLGEHRERCLVCEFGLNKGQEAAKHE
jgi:hypothetical protein